MNGPECAMPTSAPMKPEFHRSTKPTDQIASTAREVIAWVARVGGMDSTVARMMGRGKGWEMGGRLGRHGRLVATPYEHYDRGLVIVTIGTLIVHENPCPSETDSPVVQNRPNLLSRVERTGVLQIAPDRGHPPVRGFLDPVGKRVRAGR